MTNSLKSAYTIELTANPDYVTTSKLEATEVSKAINKLHPDSRTGVQHAIAKDKQMISRRLLLAKQSKQATAVCSETGIITLLDIPAIKGFALTYINPISILENSRGIAQRGRDYLRLLDTQVLSGILITLANDYSLFRYQPSDSGAQKNAIVRSIHRDTIILAILLIEESVHSGNHAYLPQFSMIWDNEAKPGEFDIRFQSWMTVLTEAIYKPDLEVYDENATVQGKLRAEYRAKNKLVKEADSAIRKKERELKSDCKAAHTHISQLFKDDRISAKLRMTLMSIYQEFQILTMDSGAKALLISKLESIVHPSSASLVGIIKADRGGLVAKNTPLADFFEDTPKTVTVIKKDNTVQVIAIQTPPELICAEGEKVVTIGERKFKVITATYDALSFMERVKFNKALLAT